MMHDALALDAPQVLAKGDPLAENFSTGQQCIHHRAALQACKQSSNSRNSKEFVRGLSQISSSATPKHRLPERKDSIQVCV
jgi:hypothetical protein